MRPWDESIQGLTQGTARRAAGSPRRLVQHTCADGAVEGSYVGCNCRSRLSMHSKSVRRPMTAVEVAQQLVCHCASNHGLPRRRAMYTPCKRRRSRGASTLDEIMSTSHNSPSAPAVLDRPQRAMSNGRLPGMRCSRFHHMSTPTSAPDAGMASMWDTSRASSIASHRIVADARQPAPTSLTPQSRQSILENKIDST